MKATIRNIGTVLLILTFFSGCMMGPDFVPPKTDTPEQYRFQPMPADKREVNLAWWELFNDPVLVGLVNQALDSNRDIRIAAARIEEARTFLGFTKPDQYPRIDIEGDARIGNFIGGTRSGTTDHSMYIAPVLKWELDFWGKFRRSTEAARAQLVQSEFALKTIQLSLVSEVVSVYYRLLDYQQRLMIAEQTLQSRLESLELIQQRFDFGIIPELDLNQAQIQKEIAAAAIPLYERLIAQTENALNILVGRMPQHTIDAGAALRLQSPPEIPAGLPSALLERRPDVAESMAAVHAQTARIGVAETLRLPAISLTGLLGVATAELGDTTAQGGVWRASAGLLGPVFDFGKNARRVEIEEARLQQTLIGYERTVLTAFREVEDALVEVSTYQRELAAVSSQAEAARNANQLSKERYDKGATSYLEVLETERQLFSTELNLSEVHQRYLNAYVKLYKALGGGWMTKKEMRKAIDQRETENADADVSTPPASP